MKTLIAALAVVMLASTAHATEMSLREDLSVKIGRPGELVVAQRRSCKAASSCQEAVEMWCGGYSGADRDNDGIPCENVCRSRAQVEAIKKEIGC
jgi:hypothetical protein